MDKPVTASLSFEPGSISTTVGSTVDISLNIFTDTEPVLSTDIWITYNPTRVKPILTVKNGDTFQTVDAKIVYPGKLYVYGINTDRTLSKPANGTVAVLSFTTLSPGTNQFSFECSSETNTGSQIIRNSVSLENIINCTRTVSHTASVEIKEGTVMGLTDTYQYFNMTYLTATVIILIATGLLFIKYRSQTTQKKDSEHL